MRTSVISYRTLFKYAYEEWDMEWALCHKYFLKSNALKYNGTSETFYLEDLEMDFEDDNYPAMFIELGATAYKIIYFFMLEYDYSEVKFRHY